MWVVSMPICGIPSGRATRVLESDNLSNWTTDSVHTDRTDTPNLERQGYPRAELAQWRREASCGPDFGEPSRAAGLTHGITRRLVGLDSVVDRFLLNSNRFAQCLRTLRSVTQAMGTSTALPIHMAQAGLTRSLLDRFIMKSAMG
jgi:hypothetical protein